MWIQVFRALKLKPLLELRSRRNFLVLLFRRVYTGFFNSLPQQYTSLYVVSIGFSIVDLGVMRSFASLASSIVNPIVGFIADIKGRKKAFTIVLLVEMLGALFYFIACDWNTLALAVVFSFTSMLAATNIENIFIADIIRRRTRATGFSIMNFLSRVSVTISPLIAAYIVDTFGGIGAEGIRPLFLIQVVGLSLCAIPAFLLLEETLNRKTIESFSQVVDDVKEIVYELKEHYWLRLWILVEVFGGYVWATTMPYLMIYAVDIKGADAWILGYMGASFNIASLAATIPWGRIGDKIGRVKTILLARPLFYLSTLIFLYAPDASWLILALMLRGLFFASNSLFQALVNELVPRNLRGRWSGIRALISQSTRIPAPLVGSYLWTMFAPETPFLAAIVIDALIRVPLVASLPETLRQTG